MIITKLREMDLLEPPVQEPVHAVQCDANTRAVAVTLTAGGVAWEPPADTAISVAFKKPDGKKGWYDKLPDGSPACSVSGNVVTAILAPEVLTAAGKVDAVIVFQDKDLNQLATFGFAILAEPNPAAGNGISNDYYSYTTMEAVSDAVEEMLDSLEGAKADIGQLILQAGEAVARVEQEAGPAIVCEETGAVITVADSSDRQLQGLRVFGKTLQNCTPSPDAPVELENAGADGSVGVTVAGKNLIAPDAIKTMDNTNIYVWKDKGVTLPAGTYTMWYVPGTKLNGMYVRTPTTPVKTIAVAYGVSRLTFTLTEATLLYLDFYATSIPDNSASSVMLERGSVPTTYEPYKPAQTLTVSTPNGLPGIPVTSGGNYTDASGQQWICDEIDFARGVYVQRIGKRTFNGQESWSLFGSAYPNLFTCYRVVSSVDRNAFLSTAYKRFDGNYGESMAYFAPPYTSGNFSVNDVRFTTLAEFTGYLAKNPLKVEYVLQTPIETPLSAEELAAYTALHTNKPNTTIFNGAGAHMEVAYVADTKLYIDQKFTALENAILSAGANV